LEPKSPDAEIIPTIGDMMKRGAKFLAVLQSALLSFVFCGLVYSGCPDKKYLQAEETYNKALKASSPQEQADLFELAFATCPSHGNFSDGYYKLAKLYYDRREKEKAFEWLLEANRFRGALLEESVNDLAQTNLLLSNLYKDKGNSEQALVHLNIYRVLTKKRDKGLEQNLLNNAEAFFAVVYSSGTVKDVLAIDKSIARKNRAELNRLEVYFPSAKSSLDDESKKKLDTIGEALLSKDFSGNTIIVEGHTDEAGGESYNCRLGNERADSVVNYLKNTRGVADVQFVPASYGKSSPTILRQGNNKKDWANIDRYNRRVVIWNMGSEKSQEKDIKVEAAPQSPCTGR
jgi:outer membrane protein OmpA-like peptidoglycan-associated protein